MLYYEFYDSPIGKILLVTSDEHLLYLGFLDEDTDIDYEIEEVSILFNVPLVQQKSYITHITTEQLDAYFKGELKNFTIPIKVFGTTFQKQVWTALYDIPYGETSTYKQQATSIGREKALRAVGSANSKNKIAIIVPCHRVVGANNNLTGFAGGIWRKKWLIEHEQKNK